MEKRGLASRIMRIVSVLGIICLLALQWVWWRNAYEAVEVDFLKNAQECVKRAASKALLKQLDDKKRGIKVVDGYTSDTSFLKKAKVRYVPPRVINTYEMDYVLEALLNVTNKPITDSVVEVELIKELQESFKNVPEHHISIRRLETNIDSLSRVHYNRIAIESTIDTIYHQIGFKAYIVTTLPSPISYYLKKGGLILLFSLLLALLVGVVLVFQYFSMLRERRFSDFIKDYTRMIAHDLRTPVTGIQMIFQMLKKNPASEVNEKYFSDGANLTKKILLNLDNILYVAKSEQNDLPVHRSNVDMRTFMENAVKMHRERDYSPKSVTIETRYEPDTFMCNMDVDLMENVIENLVENAIKYTGDNAKILLTCKYEKDVVVIHVQDNGIGISEEDQKRIFKLFECGSAIDKTNQPSFGIGLHFVQRAVNAHGGKITVKSEINNGTDFIIRFFS